MKKQPLTNIVCLLGLINVLLTNKVFEFEKNSSGDGFAFSTLSNKPDTSLPDHFILCSSHFQKSVNTINTHTVYVIYQDDGMTEPWLNIGVWGDGLWVNIKLWHIF